MRPDWSNALQFACRSLGPTMRSVKTGQAHRLIYAVAGGTYLDPFVPSGLLYLNLDQSIPNNKGVWVILLLPCFIETPLFTANRVVSDQMSYSVVSNLDLHCLPMFFLWDARHILGKVNFPIFGLILWVTISVLQSLVTLLTTKYWNKHITVIFIFFCQ